MKDKGIGTAAAIGIIIVIVAIAAGGYYTYSQGGGENVPENQTSEKIPMGLMMPLTGDLSFISDSMTNGGQLAAKEINDAGGILDNQKINIVLEDTETSPTASVDAASKLIQNNNVQVIVGPASSGDSKAILNKSITNQVVQIGPSVTGAYFTAYEDNGYFFRTCLSDTLQATAMAKIAENENYKTASTLVLNNTYGTGFAEIFAREFEERGGEILTQKAFNKDTSTFTTIIDEVTKDDPDVIVLCCYHKNGGEILKQAYQQGVMDDTDWLLSEGLEDENLADAAGSDKVVEGLKGTTPKATRGAGYQSYENSYKEEYGESPGIYSPHTYDAVAIAALATQEAGVYDGSKIKEHILSVSNPPGQKVSDLGEAIDLLKQGKEINYQGASSQITYDNVGDVTTGSIQTWWFENGKIKYGKEIPLDL